MKRKSVIRDSAPSKPSRATSTAKVKADKSSNAASNAVKTSRLHPVPAITVLSRELRQRRERAKFSALLEQPALINEMAVVKLVQERLPVEVIDHFLTEGVTQQEVDKLIAPRRTQTHRRANAERLTVDESDRAVRLARVVAQTESVFDNKIKAMHWLRQPMKRFEGRSPIDMLETDVGSRLVEESLVRIDEGFFA